VLLDAFRQLLRRARNYAASYSSPPRLYQETLSIPARSAGVKLTVYESDEMESGESGARRGRKKDQEDLNLINASKVLSLKY
jgi:hypothetical protein